MFQIFSKQKKLSSIPPKKWSYLESISRKRGKNIMSIGYQQAQEASI